MEGCLTIQEQIKLALDGRSQKWLCLEIKLTERAMSARMSGKVSFTKDEINRINARLKCSVQDYPQSAEDVFPREVPDSEAVRLTA